MLKTFKFKAWIHPKVGGSDYPVMLKLKAKDFTEAKDNVELYLKRKSAVIDYVSAQ